MERLSNNEAAEPDAYTLSERRKQDEEETSNKQKGASVSEHQPIQLYGLDEQGQIILHEEALKIFEDDKLKDKRVCVISISGEFRKGKSFLFNFFIRFLKLTKNRTCSENWLEDETEPIGGFLWKASSELQTKGIVMWSEIFLIKLNDSNEEVAVVLLDTQGCYDNKTGMVEMSSIFSLTTLLSSVQIYNVQENLNLNHFQTFQVFMDYARLLFDNNQEKPFQQLLILIRDWSNDHEFAHGSEKGQDYLNFVFQQHEQAQEKELKAIKSDIYSCFEKVDCFLMPHPGLKVTRNAYTGNVQDIEERLFVEHVKKLVVEVFDPRNLSLKKFVKGYATCSEFAELVRGYWQLFKSGKQPKMESIYSANSTIYLNHLISKLENEFEEEMLKCEPDEELQKLQTRFIEKFDEVHKMGDDKLVEEFRQKFIERICIVSLDYWNDRLENEFKLEILNCESKEDVTELKTKYIQTLRSSCKIGSQELIEEYLEKLKRNISNAISICSISILLLEKFKTEVLKCNSKNDLEGLKTTFRIKSDEAYIMEDKNFIEKCREKNAKAISNYAEICLEKITLQDEFKRFILECKSDEDVIELQAIFDTTFKPPHVMEDNRIPTSSQQLVSKCVVPFNGHPQQQPFFQSRFNTSVVSRVSKYALEKIGLKSKKFQRPSVPKFDQAVKEDNDWNQKCLQTFKDTISSVVAYWRRIQELEGKFKKEMLKCRNEHDAERIRGTYSILMNESRTENQDCIQECRDKFKDKMFTIISIWNEGQRIMEKFKQDLAECDSITNATVLGTNLAEKFSNMFNFEDQKFVQEYQNELVKMMDELTTEEFKFWNRCRKAFMRMIKFFGWLK